MFLKFKGFSAKGIISFNISSQALQGIKFRLFATTMGTTYALVGAIFIRPVTLSEGLETHLSAFSWQFNPSFSSLVSSSYLQMAGPKTIGPFVQLSVCIYGWHHSMRMRRSSLVVTAAQCTSLVNVFRFCQFLLRIIT